MAEYKIGKPTYRIGENVTYSGGDGAKNFQSPDSGDTFKITAAPLTGIKFDDDDPDLSQDGGTGHNEHAADENQKLIDGNNSYTAALDFVVRAKANGTTYEFAVIDIDKNNDSVFQTSNAAGEQGQYIIQVAGPPIQAPLTLTVSSITRGSEDIPYDTLCFTAGTRILTEKGGTPVEDIRRGDPVLTRDNGYQPTRWIGVRKLSTADLDAYPNLRPIRIRAGALGRNVPAADLVISPQHRVLVRSKIAQRMFGTNEVLVAAKQLLEIDRIDIAEDLTEVEYFHILFDRHETVWSNGAETESLYTGPEALKSIGHAAREEIFTLFPELRNREPAGSVPSARLLVPGRQARNLVARHIKNSVPLC